MGHYTLVISRKIIANILTVSYKRKCLRCDQYHSSSISIMIGENTYDHLRHGVKKEVTENSEYSTISNHSCNLPQEIKEGKCRKVKYLHIFIAVAAAVIIIGLLTIQPTINSVNLGQKVDQEQFSFLNSKIQKLNKSIEYKLRELQSTQKDNHEQPTLLNSDIQKPNQSVEQKPFEHERNSTTFRDASRASSCAAILQMHPSSPSAYYWVQSSNGSNVTVYCDMTRICGGITGGWMRVTQMNISEVSTQCPTGLCLNSIHPRTCRICSNFEGCSFTAYPMVISYSRVCGRILGYQVGPLDGFHYDPIGDSMHYDGIEIMYNNSNQHIWSFVVAESELDRDPTRLCPCINPSDPKIPPPPSFVGSDYFCDTAAVHNPQGTNIFFSNNTLWDGTGCGNQNVCCSFNNPPWFYKQLPDTTTDNIEMRVCRTDSRRNEDIAIETIDIYVQ